MPAQQPNPAHDLGRRGESLARHFLLRRGWVVLATNYRFGRREVDLVVRRGRLVSFVEVKTRTGSAFGAPEDAVTGLKRREIEAVAQEFLVRHRMDDVDVRFDVVSIRTGRTHGAPVIRHLEDAWRPDPPR